MGVVVPHFDFRVAVGVAADTGRTRADYEDRALVAPERAFFALADGMGGHAAGELAAQLAVEEARAAVAGEASERVREHYAASPNAETRRAMLARLRRVVARANERVRAEAAGRPDVAGMGATLDLVWLARDHAFIAHTGDGRVYLARAHTVIQLTQDHAEREEALARGAASPHGHRATTSRLLHAVGLAHEVRVDTLFVDLARGDRLLLATDGVHAQVGDEAELSRLLRAGSPEEAARGLVARAAERGRDNATAIDIEVGERFVRRPAADRGLSADELARARSSPLLTGLSSSEVFGALAAAVEVELDAGQPVPRVLASDLVAYLVLDGLIRASDGRVLGAGALLFAESLAGVWSDEPLPTVTHTARLLRIRADDFDEVCRSDHALAAALYRRLAAHLARASAGRAPGAPER
ncbi:MAG: protein phosphatase 2C domain-containing protein [Sorangiineae bacterium]|nr:protein phosphatase 2C domain-containing protein [Sorangiineae bacterium]